MLAPWPLGCRETPVTATRLLARNADAASLILVIPCVLLSGEPFADDCGGSQWASVHWQRRRHGRDRRPDGPATAYGFLRTRPWQGHLSAVRSNPAGRRTNPLVA